MSTLLGYGLLAVACLVVASIPISFILGRVIRLAHDPRPASPHCAEAGRVRPAGAAHGHRAVSSARQGPRHSTTSRLVLVQPRREEGPAAGDAAGPTNLTTP